MSKVRIPAIAIRIPAATAVALATASAMAHCSMSEFARRAFKAAMDDPQRLTRAFAHRFGQVMGEPRATRLTMEQELSDGMRQLALHTNVSLNDVCAMAIEAAIFRL